MENRDYGFYIDRAKAAQGFKYDNQLDVALGFKGSMINHVKTGKRHLSEEKMVELAKLAGIDPAVALLDLGAWTSEGEARKTYAAILEKIKAVLVILATAGALSAPPAHASPAPYRAMQKEKCCAYGNVMYIMENNIQEKAGGGFQSSSGRISRVRPS